MNNPHFLKTLIDGKFNEILIARGEISSVLEDSQFTVFDFTSIEELDRTLCRKKYDLTIIETPGNFGKIFITPQEIINFVRNSSSKLMLISDFSPYELELETYPDFLWCRNHGKNEIIFNGIENIESEENVKINCHKESCFTANIAEILVKNNLQVNYTGLPQHEKHKQARRNLRGYGNRLYVKADISSVKKLNLEHDNFNVEYEVLNSGYTAVNIRLKR